jgi:hypothetical protein
MHKFSQKILREDTTSQTKGTWKNNIEVGPKKMGREDADWIHL